jgi:5-methyltetrahydropteroyltriglutamate--homocysteine methyltransferase
MATTYRAEHVGSLLRPPHLLRAREAHETGELTTAQLHEVEDRAIAELLDIQKQAGLTVFTDGEARRESWRAGLLESLGGVEPASRTLRWYRNGKELSPQETLSDGAVAVATVSRKQDLTGVEATFMAARAPGTFKITMISASMGGMIWDRERSSAVYPAPNDLIEDLAALQVDEIDGLAARGVRWVQLDSLSYNQVIDPGATGRTRAALAPEQALDAAITVQRGARRQVPARVRHGAGRRLRAAPLRPARADGGPRPGHHQSPPAGNPRRPAAPHRRGRPLRAARAAGAQPAVRLRIRLARQPHHGRR